MLDVIHVLGYLWEAAKVFCGEDAEAAEAWVAERMSQVLPGRARTVAAGIRGRATRGRYAGAERKTLDRVVGYLDNNAVYMDYPHALANGWPIAGSSFSVPVSCLSSESEQRDRGHDVAVFGARRLRRNLPARTPGPSARLCL